MMKKATRKQNANQASRGRLYDALVTVKPSILSSDLFPTYQNVLIEDGAILSYNDITAVQYYDNALKAIPNCLLPGDLLIKLVSEFASDVINLSLISGPRLQVKCGKHKSTIPLVPMEDFTFRIPDTNEKKLIATFEVGEDFCVGLDMCMLSVNPTPLQPEQSGVILAYDSDNKLCLYSTDNVTISKYMLDPDQIDSTNFSDPVILPQLFCKQFLELFDNFKDSDLSLEVYGSYIVAVFDGEVTVVLFSKLISYRKLRDIDAVIRENVPDDFIAEIPKQFGPALSRSLVFSDSKEGFRCQADFYLDEIVITADTIRGKVEEQVKVSDLLIGPTARKKMDGLVSVNLDSNKILRAIKNTDSMALMPRCLVFEKGRFMHLVACL